MGKRKPWKTYFVFATVDGELGIGAGLECSANREVKSLDREALTRNGFKERGGMFTRSGKISFEHALEMRKEGKLVVGKRVHVTYFLNHMTDYQIWADGKAAQMKRWLEEAPQRQAEQAAREAEEARRKAEVDAIKEKYPILADDVFQDDVRCGYDLEKYGFFRLDPEHFVKNGVHLYYDGDELSQIAADDWDIETMGFDIPGARGNDDNLKYRLGNDNYKAWIHVIEQCGLA